jgi:predicted esterase
MKLLIRSAGVFVALFTLWLLASLYLTGQAGSIVFQNQVSWAPVPFDSQTFERIYVRSQSPAKNNVSLWYHSKPGVTKTVLYLHGNAGRIPDFFPPLNNAMNVLSPAYPGYHESEGSPTVENVYETAEMAYDYLVNVRKVPEENIVIFGHSMGGSPAVYLASKRPKASKLVIANTFSSVQSMCFRQYSILCGFAGNIFNSAYYAKSVTIPVVQFAYPGDTTLPFEEGKTLFTYFPNESKDGKAKKFIELKGHTHTNVDFTQVLPEITN